MLSISGDERRDAERILVASGWSPTRDAHVGRCFLEAAGRFEDSQRHAVTAIVAQVWGLRVRNRAAYRTLFFDCDYPEDDSQWFTSYERYAGEPMAPCAWDLDYCVYVSASGRFYGAGDDRIAYFGSDLFELIASTLVKAGSGPEESPFVALAN